MAQARGRKEPIDNELDDEPVVEPWQRMADPVSYIGGRGGGFKRINDACGDAFDIGLMELSVYLNDMSHY